VTATPPPSPADPELQRIFETSHRMFAGLVPGGTAAKLRQRIAEDPARYPWEEVVAIVNAAAVPPADLIQRGLRAQRDWILRAAAGRPMRRLRVAGKTLLARILAQLLFFGLYSAAVVVLLLLLKLKWEGADIYRLLDMARSLLPGLVGR
jgi:hypothetical protein